MIVRWGVRELPMVLAELRIAKPLLVASDRWNETQLGIRPGARWAEVPSERIADAAEQAGDGVVAVGGGSAIVAVNGSVARRKNADSMMSSARSTASRRRAGLASVNSEKRRVSVSVATPGS